MAAPPIHTSSLSDSRRITVAVDTGGTFTDLVAQIHGEVVRIKTPSTPHDPSIAVASALADLRRRCELSPRDIVEVRHGTTVATNALLERTGARVVLITNAGFEDVIALGRQDRPDLYAIHPQLSEALVTQTDRVGIRVRRGPQGQVWEPLEPLDAWLDRHRQILANADSFALCLLHAWCEGEDEARIAEALRRAFPDTSVTLSHQLSPVFREYERCSTTVVNAYIAPVMTRYLRRLAQAVIPARLTIQGSSGNLLSAEEASQAPARTVLSGPAGGVQGAWRAGQRLGYSRLIALDMGGTSTDVSLIAGRPQASDQRGIGSHPVRLPLMPIETIGAGGGSVAWVDGGGALRVGPHSAGAVPGPACYGRAGPNAQPTVTDAHVVLGRIPQLLSGGAPCDKSLAYEAVGRIAEVLGMSTEAAAKEIVAVTTASMARACKRVSMMQGLDPKDFALVAFGGAGGLHACEVADEIGCTEVIFPEEPGVLSAQGILHAQAGANGVVTVMKLLDCKGSDTIGTYRQQLERRCVDRFEAMWGHDAFGHFTVRAELRYQGQTWTLFVPLGSSVQDQDLREDFQLEHGRRFGYTLERPIQLVALHGELTEPPEELPVSEAPASDWHQGPEAISVWSATLWVPSQWRARQDGAGGWVCQRRMIQAADTGEQMQLSLEVHRHRLAAIAEQMGARLQSAALSANIKERRDFSCAIFDSGGQMLVHAAHIPVHLGSTPASVAAVLSHFLEQMPQHVVVNDPFQGGTHLPDVTLVSPVYVGDDPRPRWYVANRAHHADVGGISPGSMPAPIGPDGLPLSLTIDDEGFRTGPRAVDDQFIEQFAAASRTPLERRGDLMAQIAANQEGTRLLQEMATRHGALQERDEALLAYAERRVRQALSLVPDGVWRFEDALDDDGTGEQPLKLAVTLSIRGDEACIDLRDAPDMCDGPLNAVRAIAVSATFYVIRSLASALVGRNHEVIPANSGLMRPIQILTQRGTLVDAVYPAAVSSGNVETSQRLVDVLWGVFAKACPEVVPAASCGTMNNVLMGAEDEEPWVHYETIAGGAGGGPQGPGADAIQCHMTNTRNTPIEAIEHEFPVAIARYSLRPERSEGFHRGGRGVVRAYRFLRPAQVTLVTERRRIAPWGLEGGAPGAKGSNSLVRDDGSVIALPGKTSFVAQAGETVVIETPGGGAWGHSDKPE